MKWKGSEKKVNNMQRNLNRRALEALRNALYKFKTYLLT